MLDRLVLFLTLFQACLVTEVKENRLQDSAGAVRFSVPSNCALLVLCLYSEHFAGYPLVCRNKSQFQKQHTQASAAPSAAPSTKPVVFVGAQKHITYNKILLPLQ